MRQNLVKTEHAHYEAQDWAGENTSGWKPIGDTLLVLPDLASDKLGEKGLLLAPDELQERHSLASETGIVIEVGVGAFQRNWARTGRFEGFAVKISLDRHITAEDQGGPPSCSSSTPSR